MAMKHKRIKGKVVKILEEVINYLKKSRKRKSMPFKEIETIVKILFPKTKKYKRGKGVYKSVFIIQSGRKKLALKIGRKRKHIHKDYTTYKRLCRQLGERKAHRYFAKVYWVDGLFMLQKYGEKTRVPQKELTRLKDFGKKHGLKDIKKANVMKFGNSFKIVDAERR